MFVSIFDMHLEPRYGLMHLFNAVFFVAVQPGVNPNHLAVKSIRVSVYADMEFSQLQNYPATDYGHDECAKNYGRLG